MKKLTDGQTDAYGHAISSTGLRPGELIIDFGFYDTRTQLSSSFII